MPDRVYIHPLRERGSDDCWDGFTWRGWQHTRYSDCTSPRLCAVWTGTSDREVLDSLAKGE